MKKRVPLHVPTCVSDTLSDLGLRTVCRSARCPNRLECYASGTATFLLMGDICTRNCRFCAIGGGTPVPLDEDEPLRVAEAVCRMKLNYVVITSVTRDDLPDGGSAHFARTVSAIRDAAGAGVEVLVPDFQGRTACVDTVLHARPVVFNHNVETIPRLYENVRPMADYSRSLSVLEHAAKKGALVKSGLMVGLGEKEEEVLALLSDLRDAGVSLITIGQYLSPAGSPLPVAEFVEPATFDYYRKEAERLGFGGAAAGPFVRSSYKAALLAFGAGPDTIQNA